VITSSFSFPDNRQLTWYEYGQGRPLLLLHGWAMSAAAFSEIAQLLADDFRLLIPDLPGHGESVPPSRYTLEAVAADLGSWLKTVETNPISICGWSLGGMLALQMAGTGLIPIERMVLVGTTPRFTLNEGWPFGLPTTQVRALARNLRRHFEATLGEFFALAFAGEDISRERLREIRNFAVRQSNLPDKDAAGYLELLASQDQRNILELVRQPALVLHGDIDQISPCSAGRYLAETLPNGELKEFEGVGHAPFFSRPAEVASTIRSFC